MARVLVDFEEVTLENEAGVEIDGVQATCRECDLQVESFGAGPRSRRRCLALLREDCEGDSDSSHFYVDAEEE